MFQEFDFLNARRKILLFFFHFPPNLSLEADSSMPSLALNVWLYKNKQHIEEKTIERLKYVEVTDQCEGSSELRSFCSSQSCVPIVSIST
jgi:hypothetical protein